MQIGSRDRKLVEQSKGLVVFKPYFNGVLSQGVLQEVLHRNALVQHNVASFDERRCIVANPSPDVLDFRIRVLVKELSEKSKVRGSRPSKALLRQVESLIRSNATLMQKIGEGNVTGQELQDAVTEANPDWVLDGMPRSAGPLGGHVRTVQREWLSQEWNKKAQILNEDPLRKALQNSTDSVIDSASAKDLVAAAEQLFRQ
jgi:hypothetical protein